MIPAKTTAIVVTFAGAFVTIRRRVAEINPDRSAIPTPRRETRTVPSGANPVKLVTRFERILRTPSASSKLTI